MAEQSPISLPPAKGLALSLSGFLAVRARQSDHWPNMSLLTDTSDARANYLPHVLAFVLGQAHLIERQGEHPIPSQPGKDFMRAKQLAAQLHRKYMAAPGRHMMRFQCKWPRG